jgi:hypothetical protein
MKKQLGSPRRNAELLQGYGDHLRSVTQDAIGLMSGLSDAQFIWQPAPVRWSMAGCFDQPSRLLQLQFM